MEGEDKKYGLEATSKIIEWQKKVMQGISAPEDADGNPQPRVTSAIYETSKGGEVNVYLVGKAPNEKAFRKKYSKLFAIDPGARVFEVLKHRSRIVHLD